MLETSQSHGSPKNTFGLVLCHGWGMSPEYWQPLLEHFPSIPTFVWDCGYYAPDSTTPKKPLPSYDKVNTLWFAVGHSFGVVQLLKSGFAFDGIIGLQSFVNFLGDDTTEASQKKGLALMQKQFEKDPVALMKGFYKNCQLPEAFQPNAKEANTARLGEDLAALETDYSSLVETYGDLPSVWLASEDDAIVPPAVVAATVTQWTGEASLKTYPRGGHALHCHHPLWVAEQMMTFAASVVTEAQQNAKQQRGVLVG